MLMAPPIPGLRRPVQVQRRTLADILLGVLATITLAVLIIGVPVALVKVLGVPIPHKMPSMSALTGQLDLMAILKVLSVIVWLAWLQLIWCVIVEIRAAVRNVGVPERVPLAGATQSAARRLVTAALLLFSATAALSPAFAHSAAPPRPAHSISQQAHNYGPQFNPVLPGHAAPSYQAHQAPGQTTAAHMAHGHKIYVVKPPEGRYHESLWEVAHNHLGDGRRYHEIFEMNKDRIQPDGTKLTMASLIRPGWVLQMPGDAYGPGVEVVAPHQDTAAQEQAAQHEQAIHQAQAQAQANANAGAVGGIGITGGAAGAGGAADAGGGVAGHAGAGAGQGTVWPYELSAASLLAAGVLTALGRRRREQLWQRSFGRRLAVPEGAAVVAEQALRLGADDPAVQMLDTSLRQLTRALAAEGRTPPTVFAAHLGADSLHLWVAPPDPNPPQPWTAADDGQVWRLAVDAASSLDPGEALAPYPGLVSLGTNETGRVMVDLEAAHGLIAVRGPRPVVQAALAALAVELVTSRWSDRMRVTLVGFGEDLPLISPERAVVTPSLDEALPVLEQRAAEVTHGLAAAGAESVLTGRSFTTDAGAWAPHYLIMGVPPTPEQAERLVALSRTRQRTGLGFVIAGEVRGATWTWDVTDDGQLRADVLGFDLKAQLLPPEQYAAVISLFRDSIGDAPVTDPAVGAAPAVHLLPGARVTAEVGLLGPVSVSAQGPVEPERLALATEVVVYLAAHPEGVHLNVLTGTLWPRGVPGEVRDAALARVKAWLGTDDSGQPNLAADASGRLRLGSGVRVDWHVFRALMARAAPSSPGRTPSSPEEEAAYLEEALALVRGQLLDGRDPARYAWLTTDDFGYEVSAMVADAAHRLSVLRLAMKDPDRAMDAARAGLRLAFDDEQLWRDLLLSAHATGHQEVLRAVVDEVSARVALDEVMPRMAPETEALIDELLPSWRTSAA
jgi:hypothetical protein